MLSFTAYHSKPNSKAIGDLEKIILHNLENQVAEKLNRRVLSMPKCPNGHNLTATVKVKLAMGSPKSQFTFEQMIKCCSDYDKIISDFIKTEAVR